ncbi:MAG: hypothetical protein JO272_07915 [Pseudonocardiales bacterium]|nr:hypothetical protein [Pseudonocardiales bacterium]
MLADPEVSEWVALRRVSHGGVTQAGGRWVENGHRLPGHLAVALGGLLARRLIRLVNPDPTTGNICRTVLTYDGVDRYEQLSQRALQLPAAQFIALCRRFIDNDPDPIGDASPR